MKRKKRMRMPPLKKALCTALASFLFLVIFWIFDKIPSEVTARQPQAEYPAQLYANQSHDDLRHIYVTGINSAKKSVLLIIYSLSDQQIIQSLRRQAEAGIDVSVVCDSKASQGVARRLGSKVKVCRRQGAGLMHQKILVVDELNCWIGSANMTTESLQMHGNLVAGFQSQEIARWLTLKGEAMKSQEDLPLFGHRKFTVGGQCIELCFLPDDQFAVERINQLIKTAKKTLNVAMFTWTRQDFARAIVEAQQRGVKTEVVMDYMSGKGANARVLELLKSQGVQVSLSQGNGLLHHKFLYIDGKTLVNGSANWTGAAFTKNDDCFIILHDLNEVQKQFLDSLWETIRLESEAQTL